VQTLPDPCVKDAYSSFIPPLDKYNTAKLIKEFEQPCFIDPSAKIGQGAIASFVYIGPNVVI